GRQALGMGRDLPGQQATVLGPFLLAVDQLVLEPAEQRDVVFRHAFSCSSSAENPRYPSLLLPEDNMATFKLHDNNPDVKRLQTALQAAGFNPGDIDGDFGPGTLAAVVAFQKSKGLVPDGVAGVRTQAALGMIAVTNLPDITADVSVTKVALMFPGTLMG